MSKVLKKRINKYHEEKNQGHKRKNEKNGGEERGQILT
jgi:hypothetical protein